jgi:hypothetical protein
MVKSVRTKILAGGEVWWPADLAIGILVDPVMVVVQASPGEKKVHYSLDGQCITVYMKWMMRKS